MTAWRLEVRDSSGTSHYVSVEGDEDSSTADLAERLRSFGFGGRPIWAHGKTLASVDAIGDLALNHGDVLTVETRPEKAVGYRKLASGRYLVVVTGPDTGLCFSLPDGRTIVGRSDAADHVVADPLLSGCHVAIHSKPDGSIELEDLQSTNGTLCEGEPVGSTAVEVSSGNGVMPGTFFQVGTSVLTILDITDRDLAVLGEPQGATRSLPTRFRQATDPLPNKLKPPSEPSASETLPTPWWRSLTPVITGIGFAVMTGRWQFLLIVALAPIVFTVDLQRQKKRRQKANEEATAAHLEEVERFNSLVTDVRSAERARRRSAAIGGSIGAVFASARHQRLWERSFADEDFGSVDLGLADLRSTVEAGDDDALAGRPTMWGTPLTTSLPGNGSLSITGPPDRCRAVLRNLVIGLATTHSPVDLKLWFLTDPEAEPDWSFIRWLPHGFNSDTTSLISSSSTDHAALLSRLQQVIDTRTEESPPGHAGSQAGSPPGPLHIFVVDGAHLATGADLADLLTRGPAVGVIGIVADPFSVPQGINGQLRLGAEADDGSFESRQTPLVTGIRTAELSRHVAEQAARSLAGLRPTSGTVESPGSIHLTELLDLQDIDASDLVDRWEQQSPRTEAIVGKASGTPFAIDIARHGPHGLVGGMSGSGKTEFLMTLLTSLCLNNHPDDLSIVIVDFKGGVDHALTSQLPHVVGMSTNLHIDQFNRTIRLLDAEQRRRQELLSGVGSSIDAYRVARRERADLPPLPRLLVIVDEFSELLASDEGRDRLQELVRVTRIGRALGVHLFLVTQNFEGQLPPQIEANAGLRVCLRVMKPSHSKAVLDSGIAASIADRDVGRAYARFHGQELIEFQTARVAGRRRELASGSPPVNVQLMPFARLAQESATRNQRQTPSNETDMSAMVRLLSQAADETGWSKSAIPWPGDLPTVVPVAELLATHELDDGSGTFPIGLEDQPDQQRAVPLTLCDADQQVLFIGSPQAGVTEAMTMTAVSAAVLNPPNVLHIHGIDLDGSGLDSLRHLPHCGTIATRDEALALRLLRHLCITVAERRAMLVAAEVQTTAELPDSERPPDLLVLVTGADRLVRRGDDARSQLLAPLISLLSESIGTGVRLLLGGLPTVADSRLGLHIDRRFVMTLPGDLSLTSYGVPRELAVDLCGSGRAVDTSAKRLCQFATLDEGTRPATEVIRSVAERLTQRHPEGNNPPLRLTTMGWPMPLPDDLLSPPGLTSALPIGFDLETGDMAWVDADEDGPLFVVAGPSGSGRTTTLQSVGQLAGRLGWTTAGIAGSRRSPLREAAFIDHLLEPDQTKRALPGLLDSCPDTPILLLVDDAQRLNADDIDTSGLAGRSHAILLSGPIEFMGGRGGLWQKLPAPRAGLLLSPTSALDGGAVGLSGRLPEEVRADSRPGRGLLAVAGEYRQVQVPV